MQLSFLFAASSPHETGAYCLSFCTNKTKKAVQRRQLSEAWDAFSFSSVLSRVIPALHGEVRIWSTCPTCTGWSIAQWAQSWPSPYPKSAQRVRAQCLQVHSNASARQSVPFPILIAHFLFECILLVPQVLADQSDLLDVYDLLPVRVQFLLCAAARYVWILLFIGGRHYKPVGSSGRWEKAGSPTMVNWVESRTLICWWSNSISVMPNLQGRFVKFSCPLCKLPLWNIALMAVVYLLVWLYDYHTLELAYLRYWDFGAQLKSPLFCTSDSSV